ncbi:hypothetical protein QWM81_12710 [Streptomyces ficellus]|uniref:Uncharacterized protein n=1 Tax=Streptomyces ficellus TaxID=1977088 RepID=A0ABT7Z5X3_9ACTN|nr:hypothetical protein [Streptomyces ficellus]MDN3294899.1 hypothetical protein [Streptomyces ficellus]
MDDPYLYAVVSGFLTRQSHSTCIGAAEEGLPTEKSKSNVALGGLEVAAAGHVASRPAE